MSLATPPKSAPLATELAKSYDPASAEPVIRGKWDDSRCFHVDPNAEGEPYCIFIPPPNVTAALHLGHALNNTLQDVLIRAHRMGIGNKRFKVLWMPGTDHAGIATQAVVEKRLLLQGKRRTDFTREEFVAKVQEWKDEYEATIIEQLKAMGCSCDFERTRFTMDDVCATAVREAFFRLFRDGLIYRGKRLVNWDPVSQTALADDEVEMEEVQGAMHYLRYPLVHRSTNPDDPKDCQEVTWGELAARGYPKANEHDGDEAAWLTVATTRPETYLGDTAVAVNPKDPRAAALRGLSVQLPLVGRVIPVIEDDYVVMPDAESSDTKAKIATGFLKVTPGHDPNDYEIGRRHDLPIINVMAPDASISDKHGWEDVGDAHLFVELSRESARKKVLDEFKARGLLEAVKPYTHSVGHSYRSHVPIEPYMSDQWYVKVTDDRMRGSALRSMSQRSGGTGVPPVTLEPASTAGSSARAPLTEILQRSRRNLPHWEMGGSTYFVTFRLREGELLHSERQIALDAARHWHGERLTLHLATIMPDHVHLLITPMQKDDGKTWWSLSELLHSIKSFSAHAIQKQRGHSGSLWLDESFDRIVRDEAEFWEKWNYMLNNPVTAGLCARPEEYAFTANSDEQGGSHGEPRRGLRLAVTGETPVPPQTGNGDDELTFYPERYAKTFEHWHENLRDWCISRQLWWGHRIPVWHLHFTVAPDSGDGPSPGWEAFTCRGLDHAIGDAASYPNTLLRIVDTGTGRALSSEDYKRLERDEIPGEYDAFICTTNPDASKYFESQGFSQDPDVLDTWFSSALWPLSTLGWPNPAAFRSAIPEGGDLLDAFNPSSVLCTAREIITLWVSRMVMFNRFFRGQDLGVGAGDGPLPYRDVFIHAMIQDGFGQKMSKSLGNGVDPRDIIHSHGADAMRFVLVQMTTNTQDVRMPVDTVCPHCGHVFTPKTITTSAGYTVADATQACPACSKDMVTLFGAVTGIATPSKETPQAKNTSSRFDLGRNFANKLWNATRFALSSLNSGSGDGPPTAVTRPTALIDRWIISRLHRTLHAVEDAIKEYQFNVYADAMYDFVWRDFCDWYLEAIKPTVRNDPAQQQVLRTVLNAILRLLHPIMPFVTESLFPAVQATGRAGLDGIELPVAEVLAAARWPNIACRVDDKEALAQFDRIQSLVSTIRNLRGERRVQPKKKISLHAPLGVRELIQDAAGIVETLCLLEKVDDAAQRPAGALPMTCEGQECWLSGLVDAVDAGAERERLTREIAALEKQISGFDGKLNNAGYVAKAPPAVVEQTRQMRAKADADLTAARQALNSLG